MRSIAIYCGASLGNDETVVNTCSTLGKILATNNIRLIYGGASIGIMGALADSCLEHGGHVTGVLPRFLGSKEIAHKHLTELHWVDSMHERKALMVKLAEGFIALPGGLGTLDELFETWTWQQLNLHQDPIGLLNINHYYDKLIEFLQEICQKNLLKQAYLDKLHIETNPHALIAKLLANPTTPIIEKLDALGKT